MSNYLQNRHARQNYGLYNPFFDDFFKEDNSFTLLMFIMHTKHYDTLKF